MSRPSTCRRARETCAKRRRYSDYPSAKSQLSGFNAGSKIIQLCYQKSTYLIAVSGYGQDSDKEHALKAGFNAYVIKPIDFNKLERLLRKVATSESGFQPT